MENDDNDVRRLCCGSMSCAKDGALSRATSWQKQTVLPTRVELLKSRGYYITHIGLVASMPKPAFTNHPLTRCWVLTVETIFSTEWWTYWQAEDKSWEERDDHYLRHLCPFTISELPYEGINTHSPLMETPQGTFLSEEELIQVAAAALERRRARQRYENMSEERVEFRRAQQKAYQTSMSEEQIEAARVAQRIENMTEDQIIARRERQRLENMTEDQREARRTSCRNREANLQGEQKQARLDASHVDNMTEEAVKRRRARDRVNKANGRRRKALKGKTLILKLAGVTFWQGIM